MLETDFGKKIPFAAQQLIASLGHIKLSLRGDGLESAFDGQVKFASRVKNSVC